MKPREEVIKMYRRLQFRKRVQSRNDNRSGGKSYIDTIVLRDSIFQNLQHLEVHHDSPWLEQIIQPFANLLYHWALIAWDCGSLEDIFGTCTFKLWKSLYLKALWPNDRDPGLCLCLRTLTLCLNFNTSTNQHLWQILWPWVTSNPNAGLDLCLLLS